MRSEEEILLVYCRQRWQYVVVSQAEFESIARGGEFPARHLHHLRKARRLRGDLSLLLSNGEGELAEATLLAHAREANILRREKISPRASKVSLYQAVIHPSKLEILVAKATELGVDEICLYWADFSQKYSLKKPRLEAIVENAQMQAWNLFRPRLTILDAKLKDISFPQAATVFYGDWEKSGVFVPPNSWAIFVNGPEGGFSRTELAHLKKSGRPLNLSKHVLRSETAAICAVYALKALTP